MYNWGSSSAARRAALTATPRLRTQQPSPSSLRLDPGSSLLKRLHENLADFSEKLFKNLYQDRLDGPITGHVLVQISRFLKSFSAKSAKFSRNRSSSVSHALVSSIHDETGWGFL